jgi:hypothetical protein
MNSVIDLSPTVTPGKSDNKSEKSSDDKSEHISVRKQQTLEVIILRGSLEDGGANDCDDKTLKQY